MYTLSITLLWFTEKSNLYLVIRCYFLILIFSELLRRQQQQQYPASLHAVHEVRPLSARGPRGPGMPARHVLPEAERGMPVATGSDAINIKKNLSKDWIIHKQWPSVIFC